MAIRYDKKLNQEINRTIKNFNQKIARLEKEGKELLPSKITKKELKEESITRNDLRKKLQELQRFSKRGAEDIIETSTGVRITKYEYNELKREATNIKRKLTMEIKHYGDIKPRVAGIPQSATYKEMGDDEYLNLKTKRKALDKDIKFLNKNELDIYKKLVRKTARNISKRNGIFKENYLEMLTDLGYFFNYDNEKLNIIKTYLRQLKNNDFLEVFKNDRAIHAILDYYPVVSGMVNPKGRKSFINPNDIRSDVTSLYDTLYENIDKIFGIR